MHSPLKASRTGRSDGTPADAKKVAVNSGNSGGKHASLPSAAGSLASFSLMEYTEAPAAPSDRKSHTRLPSATKRPISSGRGDGGTPLAPEATLSPGKQPNRRVDVRSLVSRAAFMVSRRTDIHDLLFMS